MAYPKRTTPRLKPRQLVQAKLVGYRDRQLKRESKREEQQRKYRADRNLYAIQKRVFEGKPPKLPIYSGWRTPETHTDWKRVV